MKTKKRSTHQPELRPTEDRPEQVGAGATGVPGFLVGDLPVCYAIVRNERDRNLHHLLRIKIRGDRVVLVEKGVEDLRGILVAKMEDEILADA